MFVSLPIYLSVGAGFGFAWSKYATAAIRQSVLGLAPKALVAVVALLILVLLFSLSPFGSRFRLGETLPDLFSVGWALALGALLLGMAAGRWFAAAQDGRDQMIFLGVASLLVILAALQYDLHMLNGLTKVGAGSVSVEFSPREAQREPTPLSEGSNIVAFPGAHRLDVAIDLFRLLGVDIARDEAYARMFAGPAPGRTASPFAELGMDGKVREYEAYAKNIIGPVANLLCFLHRYQRGEESVLAVNPHLVANLRRSYQLALDGADPTIFDAASDGTPVDRLHDLIVELVGELDEERSSLVRLFAEGASRTSYYTGCGKLETSNEPVSPTLFTAVGRDRVDSNFGYFGYLAITAAVAEFAFGNRENSIQLLDREIRRQIQSPRFANETPDEFRSCEKESPDRSQDECRQGNERRLDWFRRLIMISRLEYSQDALMGAAQDDNPSLIPVRIMTLERMIGHFKSMFDHMSTDAIIGRNAFEGNFDYDANAACADPGSGNGYALGLLANTARTIINSENNELWISATHPEVVVAEPERIVYLDRYAEEIAKFDFKCLADLGLERKNLGVYRRRALDTAAAYWEARGRRFGAPADDPQQLRIMGSSPAVEIGALCKADKADRLALRALQSSKQDPMANPTSPDIGSALDERVNEYYLHTIEARLRNAPSRVAAALSEYSQGNIDQYCEK